MTYHASSSNSASTGRDIEVCTANESFCNAYVLTDHFIKPPYVPHDEDSKLKWINVNVFSDLIMHSNYEAYLWQDHILDVSLLDVNRIKAVLEEQVSDYIVLSTKAVCVVSSRRGLFEFCAR